MFSKLSDMNFVLPSVSRVSTLFTVSIYNTFLIAILTHIVYAVLTLICTTLTFDEIVQILY